MHSNLMVVRVVAENQGSQRSGLSLFYQVLREMLTLSFPSDIFLFSIWFLLSCCYC